MARIVALVVLLLALLHAYWALGGRWGLAQALGGPATPIPPEWVIWAVVTLLVLAALVVLGRAGVWGARVPQWLFVVATWGLAAVFVLVALMNAIAPTSWERFVFAPVSLLLALATLFVARAPRRAAPRQRP